MNQPANTPADINDIDSRDYDYISGFSYCLNDFSPTFPYHPTDFTPNNLNPGLDPVRGMGIAQSVLIKADTPLGLWRLVTELNAAFARGQSMQVTMTDSVTGASMFCEHNNMLPVVASTALIDDPHQLSTIIIRTFDPSDDGITTSRIACLHAERDSLVDADTQGYLDEYGKLEAHERFVTLAELFPDCGQVTRATDTQANQPLALLRSVYPDYQYPDAVRPAQVSALALNHPTREQGLNAGVQLSAQALSSGAWDLARRLDAAFRSGRDITAHVYFGSGEPYTFTPDTAATVFDTFTQTLRLCEAPTALATIAERQHEQVLIGEEHVNLYRVGVIQTYGEELRDHPYSEISQPGRLCSTHLITPADTLLPSPVSSLRV